MKISTSWLRQWSNPNVADDVLAKRLTMAGLEVDAITKVAPDFDNIVVGKVISCEQHPQADKLKLCQVNVGEKDNLQIICGAANIDTEIKVVVAKIGAILPNNTRIKKAKLRSIESFGMICSETEIGIIDSSDGIMILDADAVVGQDIRQYLDLNDNIIELDLTPDRADCFSILGVAREVCANYELDFNVPSYNVKATINDDINTNIINKKACPKYLTRLIKGVDNSIRTPNWITQKLLRCGQQVHSPIVDITNFVLLELGQPMHAFDVSKINGPISVRMATANEKIKLLNEQSISLDKDTLVIADEESTLAIAGIMGGMNSSTQTSTTDVLLESAFFDPVLIAGKARKYGLHTESSMRFERGVDFNITSLAMERATELIIDICGGECSTINELVYEKYLPKLEPIVISMAKIKKILGFQLDSEWTNKQFIALGFEVEVVGKDCWSVTPSSCRYDIRIEVDLIEELARLYGYDKLPVQKLTLEANIEAEEQNNIDSYDLSQVLVNRGYQEIVSYSFISDKYHDLISPDGEKIVISNPISSDMSIMRTSLWAGLLQTVKSNQRRGHNNARFFELGMCFNGIKAEQQLQKIAGVISNNRFAEQWAAPAQQLDFFDVKADVESLLLLSADNYSFVAANNHALQQGQSAKILKNNKEIGWIGALCPQVQEKLSLAKCYLFEIDLNSINKKNISKYKSFSRYQQSSRDIALEVDKDIAVNDLISAIKAMKQEFLIDVCLFDVYAGYNLDSCNKSVAFKLIYQSFDATLTDEQLNNKVEEVLDLMYVKYAAVQR